MVIFHSYVKLPEGIWVVVSSWILAMDTSGSHGHIPTSFRSHRFQLQGSHLRHGINVFNPPSSQINSVHISIQSLYIYDIGCAIAWHSCLCIAYTSLKDLAEAKAVVSKFKLSIKSESKLVEAWDKVSFQWTKRYYTPPPPHATPSHPKSIFPVAHNWRFESSKWCLRVQKVSSEC